MRNGLRVVPHGSHVSYHLDDPLEIHVDQKIRIVGKHEIHRNLVEDNISVCCVCPIACVDELDFIGPEEPGVD